MFDPVVAKWLMTLPEDAAPAQAARADAAPGGELGGGEMLAGTPIGGEVHELVPAQPEASAEPAPARGALSTVMLDAAPIGGEVYRLTKPVIRDVTASVRKPETGLAVWYRLPGRTASGEIADPRALTAGHRTLPLGSRVRVVNRLNGASVVVRINDRGPKQTKFVIDLSQASAKAIGLTGTAPVTLNVEQTGAIAENSARTPALEGRSAVMRGAKIRADVKAGKTSAH
jgi:rare lipoprotein A